MGKYGKTFAVLLLSIFLAGCSRCEAKPCQPDVVNRIDVSYRNQNIHLLRTYTSVDKIDAVLFYLYRLCPDKPAEGDPERLSSQRCTITVSLTGGKRHIYRLRGLQFLSVDCRPWQSIDPKDSAGLFPLLARVCSDE